MNPNEGRLHGDERWVWTLLMTKEILDPVTVVMFSINTYVNTTVWVVTLWPSLSDRGGCLSSWTTLQFSSFWYQNWTNPKWYVLSKIRLSAAHLKPLCVFTCPLQCVTLTIPARGWAATPPLKTLEWPSSRSSRFLRGTTGTASWRYLSCGRVGFSCRKPARWHCWLAQIMCLST